MAKPLDTTGFAELLQQQCVPTQTALAPAPATALSIPLLPPVGRSGYSHQAMVDLMVARPDYSHAQLCAHFGRPASWLPSVLASDSFQQVLEDHRHEIVDPSLTASLQERFKALAIHSSNAMMERLNNPSATDFAVLKAGEIAVKALGMGQRGVEQPQAPSKEDAPTQSLAERILAAMDKRTEASTIDVETVEVKGG
jgi:hypothetical protein